MLLSILFWNFNTRKADQVVRSADPPEALADLVEYLRADIVALAECPPESEAAILAALRARDATFEVPNNPNSRFRLFTRFPNVRLVIIRDSKRALVCRLAYDPARHLDVLMGIVHCVDIRNNPGKLKRLRAVQPIRDLVLDDERSEGHRRTILLGDFNMNPFHVGMLDPKDGFGALMTRELAEVHAHRDNGGEPRFYNPMWARMGQAHAPGTYYHGDEDDPENTYWHCIDQVLVRPELAPYLPEDRLTILEAYEDRSGERIELIRKKKPGKHYALALSDHLPIAFTVELPPIR